MRGESTDRVEPERKAYARSLAWQQAERMPRERLPNLIRYSARRDWADGCPRRAVEVPTTDDQVHSVTAESDAERELPLTLLSEWVLWSTSPQEEAA